MTNDKTVTMSRELEPCPFCGCQMRIKTGRDTGHRMYGDHTQKCVFPRNSATSVEITEHPDALTRLIEDWNTRAAPVVEAQCKEDMNVGDVVVAKINMDEWSDAHGDCRCAGKGEKLVLRERSEHGYWLVSHEYRTDGMTFRAEDHEIEPFSADPTNGS